MKYAAVIVATIALAFAVALTLPIATMGAYAPDGPFGFYYGMSDADMVITALVAVAIMLAGIPAGITLVDRIAR